MKKVFLVFSFLIFGLNSFSQKARSKKRNEIGVHVGYNEINFSNLEFNWDKLTPGFKNPNITDTAFHILSQEVKFPKNSTQTDFIYYGIDFTFYLKKIKSIKIIPFFKISLQNSQGLNYSNYWEKMEKKTFDTLTSSQTSNTYYLDSFYYYTINKSYQSNLAQINAHAFFEFQKDKNPIF
ncbi:MAG: hypothetical protein V4622_08990 [Bacteroidota bacterium]